jgi:methionine-rich copper-binding protein CopC
MIRRLIPLLVFSAALAINARPAYAQPLSLLQASPPPDSVIHTPITEVRLVFSHPLTLSGTGLGLYNEVGKRVDNGDVHIDPSNLYAVAVSLPEVFEGRYTVRYVVNSIGESITAVGHYSFVLDLPAPIVRLSSPLSGQSFAPGPVPVQIETRFASLETGDSTIRIYVDGALVENIHSMSYSLEGLSPGVHEVRVVLIQSGNQEVPETSNLVYIAITRPDLEIIGRELAAQHEPDPGLQLDFWQIMALTVATGILLGLGLWLGGPYLAEEDKL